ncbi:MAG: molybdopterin-dependent oxidoreductase [Planctomycetota bacterium]|jgi:DMSO/TMAO reductase YedYZ molybdopterin-dependent catalytic subunit
MSRTTLMIEGAVHTEATLDAEALAALPADARIDDVSQLDPNRSGRAVTLAGLLAQASPTSEASHVTLHSDDGFAASLPLDAVCELGIVLFEHDGEPLDSRSGGPFRFLIPNAAECKTAELDACANVKHLVRIELTDGPGHDTRRG